MMKFKRLASLLALLAVAACSGGGGDTGSAPFPATGGTPPAAVASDLSLSLSSPSVNNSGTQTVVATATAVDANRNTVSGIPVTLSADGGATLQVSGTTTSAAGVVTATVSIGANRSNRPVRIVATSGSLTKEVVLQVVGTRITSTALPAALSPGQTGKVQYRVVDVNGNALPDVDITISGIGGTQSTAKTSISGEYEYSYTAPNVAGNLDIRASAGGVENVTTVVVQTGPGVIPPVTQIVRSPSVRANPNVVAVNATAATTNRSDIRALFVGDTNAPVKNIRVRFDLDGDRNSVGGAFSTGTTLVYSDANGVALTSYIPASRFSPTDGVTIRACWDYNDFAVGACPNAVRTTLTVIAEALSVSIGTNDKIVVNDLTYSRRFIVQVNDSSGLAKADVQVSPVLDLPSYRKGFYTRVGDSWVQTLSESTCENEDLNRNGVLETYSNGQREDANGNARLDPRKADVTIAFEGPSRTSSTGQVILRIEYPQNVGSWLRYNITVAAAGVAGTEGRATYAGILDVPVDAIKAEGSPAFQFSPYGRQSGTPLIVVTTPDGSATATLCTNPN